MLVSYGCHNLINMYTRVCTNVNGVTTKTTVDHIVTNINIEQTKSGVLYFKLSDHLPTFSVLKLSAERQRPQTQKVKRIYNRSGEKKFIEYMDDYTENLIEKSWKPAALDTPYYYYRMISRASQNASNTQKKETCSIAAFFYLAKMDKH